MTHLYQLLSGFSLLLAGIANGKHAVKLDFERCHNLNSGSLRESLQKMTDNAAKESANMFDQISV